MFVQHMLAMLSENGMVVTVMPHGVLFRGGDESRSVRIVERRHARHRDRSWSQPLLRDRHTGMHPRAAGACVSW